MTKTPFLGQELKHVGLCGTIQCPCLELQFGALQSRSSFPRLSENNPTCWVSKITTSRRGGARRKCPGRVLALLRHAVLLQRLQQALDSLAGRLPPPFLATLDPRDPRGQQEGGESPRRRRHVWAGGGGGGLGAASLLFQQPGALLAQGHEAVQLRGVHVLADVEGGFERVLDVKRGHLGLVLLSTLEEEEGGGGVKGETALGSAGPKKAAATRAGIVYGPTMV